jgi:hypothetical protein
LHPTGHRKIFGLMRADGHRLSPSSVERAMRRRGLLQPIDYQAERRELAKARSDSLVITHCCDLAADNLNGVKECCGDRPPGQDERIAPWVSTTSTTNGG